MNIIVTGGNSKIGKKLIPLLSANHSLSINSRSPVVFDGHISLNSCNLTNKRGIISLLKKSFAFFGSIEAFINLTGYLSDREMLNFTKKEFFMEMEKNLFSYFLLCKCLIENTSLISRPFTILNFTLQNPDRIYKRITFHNISKSGLETLSLSFNKILEEHQIVTKCIRLPDMQKGTEKINDLYCTIAELLHKNPADSGDILDFDSNLFLT